MQVIDGRRPPAPSPLMPQVTPEGNALRGALDALPVGIALFDAEGRPTVVNRSAREILGRLADLGLDAWGTACSFTTHEGHPTQSAGFL